MKMRFYYKPLSRSFQKNPIDFHLKIKNQIILIEGGPLWSRSLPKRAKDGKQNVNTITLKALFAFMLLKSLLCNDAFHMNA